MLTRNRAAASQLRTRPHLQWSCAGPPATSETASFDWIFFFFSFHPLRPPPFTREERGVAAAPGGGDVTLLRCLFSPRSLCRDAEASRRNIQVQAELHLLSFNHSDFILMCVKKDLQRQTGAAVLILEEIHFLYRLAISHSTNTHLPLPARPWLRSCFHLRPADAAAEKQCDASHAVMMIPYTSALGARQVLP